MPCLTRWPPRQDRLDGLHSNTQIPKLIGYWRIHELTGEADYGTAAEFFWQTVTQNRSYVLGGNGDYEHFFPPAKFADHLSSDDQAETCCTYNMLKLTRQLFQRDPSAAYADYYERALLNHILASQEPGTGHDDVLRAHEAGPLQGLRRPDRGVLVLHRYRHREPRQVRRLRSTSTTRIPCTSTYSLRRNCAGARSPCGCGRRPRFPEQDTTRLTLTCAKPTKFALRLRHPFWAQGMTVSVNGKRVKAEGNPGSYVTLDRTWRDGDVVEARLPMALRLEPLPHTPDRAAICYGPVVLAGAMGREGMGHLTDTIHQQDAYNSSRPCRPRCSSPTARPAAPHPPRPRPAADVPHGGPRPAGRRHAVALLSDAPPAVQPVLGRVHAGGLGAAEVRAGGRAAGAGGAGRPHRGRIPSGRAAVRGGPRPAKRLLPERALPWTAAGGMPPTAGSPLS